MDNDELGFRTPIEIREAWWVRGTDPEAKLLRIPVGDAALRAQVRRFEQERDCHTVGVRASSVDFTEATRLATPLALAVEVDGTVRAGHLVLVGGNGDVGKSKT